MTLALPGVQVAWWTTFEEKHRAEVAAESSVFGGESGKKRQEDLRLRVIEHNILVIAKYYSRITVARLAQLLDLPEEEVRASSESFRVAQKVVLW